MIAVHVRQAALAILILPACVGFSQELPSVEFHAQPNQLTITAGSAPIATYVYSDPKIPRPYFCNAFAPNRVQVTRNQPPRTGKDGMDHELLHPGIWLAYADMNGNDSWRLKAKVVHDRFIDSPRNGVGDGSFQVRNKYLNEKGDKTVCEEMFRTHVWVRPTGYLLVIESEYSSLLHDVVFGDQEEMGLGVRVATPLSVVKGGQIRDAEGRTNEQQIWGKSANWVDYSGLIDGAHAGIMVIPDPANFRPSRYHARDYGFVAANPFAIKSFRAGEASRFVVKRFEYFKMRFAVLLHSTYPFLFLCVVQMVAQKPMH